jgi:hypothetical protein
VRKQHAYQRVSVVLKAAAASISATPQASEPAAGRMPQYSQLLMSQQKQQQLLEAVKDRPPVIFYHHPCPDGKCFGCGCGADELPITFQRRCTPLTCPLPFAQPTLAVPAELPLHYCSMPTNPRVALLQACLQPLLLRCTLQQRV